MKFQRKIKYILQCPIFEIARRELSQFDDTGSVPPVVQIIFIPPFICLSVFRGVTGQGIKLLGKN